MIELDVLGVRVDMPGQSPILLLRECGGSCILPIWIGASEAAAIVSALEGSVPQRPSTYDLFTDLLAKLGHDDVSGRLVSYDEGRFCAELVVDGVSIDCRPSDLVAISLRVGFSIGCSSELMAEVGVEASKASDDEVEKFRVFLDSITPDDFDE